MKPVFVGVPEQKKKQVQDTPVAPHKPRKKGLLSRIAEIVSDDINFYIRGIKSEQRHKWEDYERFCELARKGR